jgi:hypothetical protein
MLHTTDIAEPVYVNYIIYLDLPMTIALTHSVPLIRPASSQIFFKLYSANMTHSATYTLAFFI